MRFSNDRPIFTQIADMLEDQIVSGILSCSERLPSARDLATSLGVNPNTAARALQILAERDLAESTRGTGYFVAENAGELARNIRRNRFFEELMPKVFKEMDDLGITIDELVKSYSKQQTGRIK
ncbi:GntR family transcriptional regulator [Spirochaeta dissipatitropha]